MPTLDKLRTLGQEWTPKWVADEMIGMLGHGDVLDPGFGSGVLYQAWKHTFRCGHYYGVEYDPDLVAAVPDEVRLKVAYYDFLRWDPGRRFANIVANPPYLRHHRLCQDQKEYARDMCRQIMGQTIDARAGLHVYFLIKSLSLLELGGNLVFIVPSDVCEGIFAEKLWKWITANYRVERVITFSPRSTPFPRLDINPLILHLSRKLPSKVFSWCRLDEVEPGTFDRVECSDRLLEEGLSTGLSRPPTAQPKGVKLGDLADVRRGIATGANEFFLLTRDQVQSLDLDASFFRRAVGRTRDIEDDILNDAAVDSLEEKGRPTHLLALRGDEPIEGALAYYLGRGVQQGLPEKALIATRRPWYRMETRQVPPILFAYLGRDKVRFILNVSKALPLTGFLCVYPRPGVDPHRLWVILNNPRVIANLSLVGKSYGSGAIKVEPKSLERLVIPTDLAAFITCPQGDTNAICQH